ncbi:MAG: hypothetical protein ACQEQL_06390 [Pseudomonadota bacterium]
METEQNPRGLQMFKIWKSFIWRWLLWIFLAMIIVQILAGILYYSTGIESSNPIVRIINMMLLAIVLPLWAYYKVFQQVMGRQIAGLQLSLVYDGPESEITENELLEKADRQFFISLSWALLWRETLWRTLGIVVICLACAGFVYGFMYGYAVLKGEPAKLNLSALPPVTVLTIVFAIIAVDIWAFTMAFRQLLKRKIGELQLTLFKTDGQSAVY